MIDNVYNIDCIVGLREMESESVDAVITDPPYLTNYKTNYRKDKTHRFCAPIANDTTTTSLLNTVLPELYRVLKPNTAFYCFCSPDTIEIFKPAIAEYFRIKNVIVWVKNNWTAGDLKAQFGKQYEVIIYANKGRRFINGPRLSDVWNFPRIPWTQALHQNQKPVELIRQMIRISTDEGQLVLDPFMGSGTTAIAALEEQRHFTGFEIDTDFFSQALARIDRYQEKEQPYGLKEAA